MVAAGTPEQVAAEPRSYTGQYLKPLLAPAAAPKKKVAAARKTTSRVTRTRKAG